MAAQMTVVSGPARCGKTTKLLEQYRQKLAEHGPGSTLWLAPTEKCATAIRKQLLNDELRACLAPGVITFAAFADQVLRASGGGGRAITELMKRRLIVRLIRKAHGAGQLQHFGPIADTPGLVDLIGGWILEMKRLEIWPEEFQAACRQRTAQAKDLELFAIYQDYQRQLTRYDLYDPEGRFWLARALLRSGQRRPFEQVRFVVADGFADFTRTEHEILEILSQRVNEVIVTLPLEASSATCGPDLQSGQNTALMTGLKIQPTGEPQGRSRDLFAKPQATLGQLVRRHPGLTHVELPRNPRTDWPALGHLERELFKNPREQQPAPSKERIEILAAARELGEIEAVGRRIKQLLIEGDGGDGSGPVRPDEIAVVFRSVERSATLVQEVFERLGLPFALECGRTLQRSPALSALVSLLRLDRDDWPIRGLLAVLSNNYFQPDWPAWQYVETRPAVESTIHRLRIPAGREMLLARVRRQAARVDSSKLPVETGGTGILPVSDSAENHGQDARATINSTGGTDHTPHTLEHSAALALPVLERLAGAFDRLPKQAAYRAWAAALAELADDTGLMRAMSDGPPSLGNDVREAAGIAFDLAAWERLQQALLSLEDLYVWLEEPPPVWTRAELLECVEDILRGEELPPRHDDAGRVRILSAGRARGLEIPYLFVAGMAEQTFPSPERHDRLYTDGEVRRLSELGLPLVHREMRGQEEMLLFYELVNRATRRLFLSYPALDEKAQPLLPSPYLVEVEQACRQPGIPGGGIPRTTIEDISPVPVAGFEPDSPAQWRVAAVAEAARTGNVSLLAGLGRGNIATAVADAASVGAECTPHAPREETGLTRSVRSTLLGVGEETPVILDRAGLLARAAWQNLLAGLELAHFRKQRGAFGRFEGLLESPAVKALFAREFAERVWSPSGLETYQGCAYRYFLKSVLHLRPLDEIELETDFAGQGVRLHETLAGLHRRLVGRLGNGRVPTDLDVFAQDYEAAIETACRSGDTSDALSSALLEIDRRLLTAWGQSYRDQYTWYDRPPQPFDAPLSPTHFEFAFGQKPRKPENADASSRLEPLLLERAGEILRIAGQIDRIDVGSVGGKLVFNIIDYKSGARTGFTKNAFRSGKSLQLPLYALAVEQLLLADRGAVPWQVGYWFVREAGFKFMATLHEAGPAGIERTDEWESTRQTMLDQVFALAAGIKNGAFPVFNENKDCMSTCDFRTVCRIGQIRSLEKTWPATNRD